MTSARRLNAESQDFFHRERAVFSKNQQRTRVCFRLFFTFISPSVGILKQNDHRLGPTRSSHPSSWMVFRLFQQFNPYCFTMNKHGHFFYYNPVNIPSLYTQHTRLLLHVGAQHLFNVVLRAHSRTPLEAYQQFVVFSADVSMLQGMGVLANLLHSSMDGYRKTYPHLPHISLES
jgi:hypothetical protein